MNGTEHYREAEQLIERVKANGYGDDRYTADMLAAAQVHATLALAAATALTGSLASEIEPYDNVHAWNKVAGVKTVPDVEPGQVNPAPAAPVRIDSLIPRVTDGEIIAVSQSDWNDGKPVDLVELHPRFDGGMDVRYGVRGEFALINATVPAYFLVTPA